MESRCSRQITTVALFCIKLGLGLHFCGFRVQFRFSYYLGLGVGLGFRIRAGLGFRGCGSHCGDSVASQVASIYVTWRDVSIKIPML